MVITEARKKGRVLRLSSVVPSFLGCMDQWWSPTHLRSLLTTLASQRLFGLPAGELAVNYQAFGGGGGRWGLIVLPGHLPLSKKQKLVVSGTLEGLPRRQTNCIF